jgi:hypothetical protein
LGCNVLASLLATAQHYTCSDIPQWPVCQCTLPYGSKDASALPATPQPARAREPVQPHAVARDMPAHHPAQASHYPPTACQGRRHAERVFSVALQSRRVHQASGQLSSTFLLCSPADAAHWQQKQTAGIRCSLCCLRVCFVGCRFGHWLMAAKEYRQKSRAQLGAGHVARLECTCGYGARI